MTGADWALVLGDAAPKNDGWLESFRPFGAFHALVLFVAALVLTTLCVLARRGGPGAADRIARSWGLFVFVWQTGEVIFYLLPKTWDIQKSLPLQLCDLAAWVAGLSLFTKKPLFRTLLYYWGLGLSSQAFFTPTVTVGAGHPKFWFFWIGHSHIVLGGLFEVIARGYRPTWRDFRVGTLAGMVYTGTVLVIDIAFDLNYGYVGNSKPTARTIVDTLGPWPWRVVWLSLIVIAGFVLITAAWPQNRTARGGASPTKPG